MRNSKEVFNEIISGIALNDSREEKESIARILMEYLFGLDQSRIMADVPVSWTDDIQKRFDEAKSRINDGEPVQYVVGEAYFYGRKFFVDRNVLIPRPETEELVGQIVDFCQRKQARILDIGTGSGCMPIMLDLLLKGSEVFGSDVSPDALKVADKNIKLHSAQVKLLHHDILSEQIPISGLDVVVSNPPYIALSEKNAMNSNVVDFEPHLALFVSDDDPLIFYRRISAEARRVLKNGGLLIFEINERFGRETAQVVIDQGFQEVKILKDLSGKERMVKAIQTLN